MNISEIVVMGRFEADGDSTNMPVAASTDPYLISINEALRKVYMVIRKADGRWQWDDSNNTDFPIGYVDNLVASQADYSLDLSMLEIEAVEVLDASGNYYPITPIDIDDIKAQGLDISEYQSTPGAPLEYDLKGNSIILYPAPASGSVTLAQGLKIHFKRGPDLFTVAQIATGTKVPGFASHLHGIVPLLAAEPFVAKRHPERLGSLMGRIKRFEAEISDFYANRMKDDQPTMTFDDTRRK